MTYYHITGDPKSGYCIFTRSTGDNLPFFSSIYIGNGSRNNVQSWKTIEGVKRFVTKKFPGWVFETTVEYKERKEAYFKPKDSAI